MIDAEMYAKIIEVSQRLGCDPSTLEGELQVIAALSQAERDARIERLEDLYERLMALGERLVAAMQDEVTP
jgi:hypothetical protein